MKLQTQIPLQKAEKQIDYESRLVFLGSCFSENIGEKFTYFKFRSLRNPFGILFHPLAIENLVSRALRKKRYTQDDIFYHNERWQCYDAHSDLSALSQETLLGALNNGLEKTAEHLATATHIGITLGTAWVYRHLETDTVVANCHKVPQRQFSKELLGIAEMMVALNTIMDSVRSINPKAQFILTVSPVRHLKDGFVENQRSKARLISAVHAVLQEGVSYFPSYEIQMDELRDYRFYKEDMVHPNRLAVEYIWEKFSAVWIVEKARPVMDRVDAVQRGLLHRPFYPDSEQHRKFSENLEKKMENLREEFPFMDF
ncbi:GSCFA domain-containing protein [Pseudozobellia thermophila]|uniref:GSCFA family protein n=1 Tax=Pseudozobellia thermophila TaxID=192903 RepID=A0A1M6NEK1_9FLAO|nr:GSCFA domain-containing protein [Pseudozobellia thermophila]SHJ94083.1 GSCFA family protein [Pseudozobellia thermophila]